jgi:hypothetical protein
MAAALAPGVSRKLKKVLETRTDSPDLLASLGALSTFYVHNTPQARRNLKSSVEQRSLAINRHFLDASLPAQKVRAGGVLTARLPPLYPSSVVWYVIAWFSVCVQALDRVEGEVSALNDSWKK